jgi:hypothetical protein
MSEAQRNARPVASKVAKPVAGGLDLPAPMAEQRSSRHGLVLVGEPGPPGGSDLGLLFGRSDDVGEQDGGRDHVGLGAAAGTGQELFDLVHDRIDVTGEEGVVSAREHHEPSPGDVPSQVAARAEADVAVLLSVQDQGGDRDRRQQRTDIPFGSNPRGLSEQLGADAEALGPGPPRPKPFIRTPPRGEQLQDRARVPPRLGHCHQRWTVVCEMRTRAVALAAARRLRHRAQCVDERCRRGWPPGVWEFRVVGVRLEARWRDELAGSEYASWFGRSS